MITLIYGEDSVSSRKALKDLLAKDLQSEKISLDGTKATLTDIISTADSLSLFGQKKTVYIENLLERPASREKDQILDFLKTEKLATDIILWEAAGITKAILNKYFKNTKIFYFPLPAILFKFLDAIGEKSLEQVLAMFHNLLTNSEAEFIFSMLVRQWRLLIIASDIAAARVANLPSWQMHKFAHQASFFELSELISSYRQLLSLDGRIKMGLTSFALSDLLDIFFVSLYYKN